MHTEHTKLVRDHIPEIIRKDGRSCATLILSQIEYVAALRQKLIEEAQEAATTDPANLVSELADICEVMDALAAALSIEKADILHEQVRKRAERGGFEQRICLMWTE